MKVDHVITLDDGEKYLLLLEDEVKEEDYFLSVQLDKNNEPTDKYIVLKEIKENGKIYVEEEKNPLILNELLNDYQVQYQDEYEN